MVQHSSRRKSPSKRRWSDEEEPRAFRWNPHLCLWEIRQRRRILLRVGNRFLGPLDRQEQSTHKKGMVVEIIRHGHEIAAAIVVEEKFSALPGGTNEDRICSTPVSGIVSVVVKLMKCQSGADGTPKSIRTQPI